MNLNRVIFLFLLPAMAGCGHRSGDTAAPEKGGMRIVSVSKQLTEIIFAVGGDTALVGRDISSTWPPEAKKITAVGYHRALGSEGIISLHPTVLWNDGNWGPQPTIEQLKKVGIPMRQFDGGNTIDSTERLIRQVAAEFHNERAGDSLCKQLDADMQQADSLRRTYAGGPPLRVLVIHFGQAANQYFVLSHRGIQQQMLDWAGAINAADTAQKWKNLSPEVIAQTQPDVILATDYGYDLQGSVEKFKQLPGIALSPAARNNHIYRIEEHDLVYLGPRTGKNVYNLIRLIHQTGAQR
ncbi:MAG TPA: ABC transporter substrate-binding protein [Puia sp.]|jgi:iron complex transport system substrate-binding protein|nr:ABC transporter substrate-binding protein [Puia sp.]